MNLEEIKQAVRDGKTVNCSNDQYYVNLSLFSNGDEQWLIICYANDYAIGLTHQDGITMNEKESAFYIK